jgi:autotransporter-associated beta strand protein
MVGGAAATLNVNSGVLTLTARLNTGTAGNATGIVNVVNGTLNVDDQVQGANGAATAASIINVSGGTFNVGGTSPATATDPLYVASRGPGSLTISGSGALNCGILDVSRSINSGIPGVVDLDGGTLTCTRVGTATANASAAATGSTATFNFNGGTLKARANSTTFFQGNAGTPPIPIAAFVKAGGAIIDTDGFNTTALEPLQHDSALGVTPDGGLTKNGAGVLTLTGASSYTGPTVVNGGTLLVNGSIGTTAVSVESGGTLGGTGNIGNNVTVKSGGTVTAGAADAVGNLTVAGNVTMHVGATVFLDLSQTAASSDQIRAIAATPTTITYAGTLALNNLAGTLAGGESFKLFSATNYSGSFSDITPATPGEGLVWNTSALNTSGTISVVAVPIPKITNFGVIGGNVVLSGTSGRANGSYNVLTTSDVSLALARWTQVASGNFDGGGSFS